MEIRPATPADEQAIWEIFQAVIAPGDTFAFEPNATREDFRSYWLGPQTRVYVAEKDSRILGSYILRPNQPGLGGHVANAGYMVSPRARGLGVGRRLGEHSLLEARRVGYRAIQFNFVVSTNTVAVELWKSLGFRILATLPDAYRHSRLGYVDAYVMHRSLENPPADSARLVYNDPG